MTPSLTCKIAFASNPLAASPSYTTLTERVRNDDPIAIQSGRNLDLNRVEAGQATLTVDNRDGAFDPEYTSGVYYPNVVPYRRIQLLATWLSNDYPLFTGFITRMDPLWSSGDNRTRLTCHDALEYFARLPLGLDPFWSYTTTGSTVTISPPSSGLPSDVVGRRLIQVRLDQAPASDVTVTITGMSVVDGMSHADVYTLTGLNFIDGVLGSYHFSSLTSVQIAGPANVTVQLLYAAAFPAARSDIQLGYVLDAAGWPASLRSLATGASTIRAWAASGVSGYALGGVTNAADTILGALQRIVESESGALSINGSGVLVFESRYTRLLTASSGVLGSGSGELPYHDPHISYNTDLIYNIIRITPQDRPELVATDQTSIDAYGRRPYAKGGLLIESIEGIDLANWLLGRYKAPAVRLDAVTLKGAASPSGLWATMLGGVIGQRWTGRLRPPPDQSRTIDKDVTIERVAWRIRRGVWEATWGFSPATAGGAWVLGDTTYGVLGSTTRLAY